MYLPQLPGLLNIQHTRFEGDVMGLLDGKVVLVTGEAEGRRAVAEGATVVVADVADEAGERVAGEMGAQYAHLDVTAPQEWEAVIAEIVSVMAASIWPARRAVNMSPWSG